MKIRDLNEYLEIATEKIALKRTSLGSFNKLPFLEPKRDGFERSLIGSSKVNKKYLDFRLLARTKKTFEKKEFFESTSRVCIKVHLSEKAFWPNKDLLSKHEKRLANKLEDYPIKALSQISLATYIYGYFSLLGVETSISLVCQDFKFSKNKKVASAKELGLIHKLLKDEIENLATKIEGSQNIPTDFISLTKAHSHEVILSDSLYDVSLSKNPLKSFFIYLKSELERDFSWIRKDAIYKKSQEDSPFYLDNFNKKNVETKLRLKTEEARSYFKRCNYKLIDLCDSDDLSRLHAELES